MKASRSCDPELYQKVKESVSMQQAVEYCGLRILNGKCRCPFHKDTHPSMKIYPNGNGYYCFVCGAGAIRSNLWRNIMESATMRQRSSWRRLMASQSRSRFPTGRSGKQRDGSV